MAFTDTVSVSYSPSGASAITTTWSPTGVGRVAYSGVIPDTTSSSGQEVDISFTYTEIVQAFLLSTQNLTINANSDGSPTQTVNINANIPTLVNPFNVNASKLYLRNNSTTVNANVTIILLTSASTS